MPRAIGQSSTAPTEDANSNLYYVCNLIHVRNLTIFIGIVYTVFFILAAFYQVSVINSESGLTILKGNKPSRSRSMLSTSTNKESSDHWPEDLPTPEASIDQKPHLQMEEMQGGTFQWFSDIFKLISSKTIVWSCFNALVSNKMIHSAIKCKLEYVMAFLILRILEFCMFCLLTAKHLASHPNPTDAIANLEELPFRDELLKLTPQLLSILIVISLIGIFSVNIFVTCVVCAYHQFITVVVEGPLARRRVWNRSACPHNNYLADLPDYETAITDPRFGNTPPPNYESIAFNSKGVDLNVMMRQPPPPPYSVAIASDFFPIDDVVPSQSEITIAKETPPSDSISIQVPSRPLVVEDENEEDGEEVASTIPAATTTGPHHRANEVE